VYPTVALTAAGNTTDLSDVSFMLDPLLAQAAPFSSLCEIYAPLYRQVSFNAAAIGTGGGGADGGDGGGSADAAISDSGAVGLFSGPTAALALSDVRGAFQYYMAHFNRGRKFVIMGHSQGSMMLAAMMKTDVDTVPDVRSRMISALLIGGGMTVAPGQQTGGSFQNIPLCAKPGDTGCMIAYSSFDVLSPPGSNALFGRSPDGNQVACTEPASLAGNSGPYRGTVFPIKVNNALFKPDVSPPADITTPFVLYRGVFQGSCVNKNMYNYLEMKLLEQTGDPRGTPPYKNTPAESVGFGLHLADYNIPLEDLIDAVKQQAAVAVP